MSFSITTTLMPSLLVFSFSQYAMDEPMAPPPIITTSACRGNTPIKARSRSISFSLGPWRRVKSSLNIRNVLSIGFSNSLHLLRVV
jgi:hypothetical protein